MAVSIKNNHGVYDDVQDTFPQSSAVSGTVSSANDGTLIVGSSTSFGTVFQVGEYIWIPANDEFRKIISIVSDTELYIDAKFTSTLSGATAKRIPKCGYKSISWSVDSAGTAKIDGIEMPASQSGTIGKVGNINLGNPVRPIIIDTTANANKVYVEFTY